MTKSRGLKGLQLEVGARRATRLLYAKIFLFIADIYSHLLKLASPQPNHLLNETESNLEIWGEFQSRRGGDLLWPGRVYILPDQWCGGSRGAVAELPINLKLIRISQWAS